MGIGKHTETSQEIKRLEKVIDLKDREIHDIKLSLADVLLEIRTINESNEYSAPEVKRRKISELCTNTRYELSSEMKLGMLLTGMILTHTLEDNLFEKEKKDAE